MSRLSALLLLAVTCAAHAQPTTTEWPTGIGFPNVARTEGALIAGPFGTGDGRGAIIAWHNGVLFTIPENPSSNPNPNLQVRMWNLMDPANPMYAEVEAMKLFKEKIAQYQPEADPTNGIVAYGWTTAALMADLLQRSPAVDRISVMETARNMSGIEGIGLMLEGQVHNVSADDWFIGETFNLVQYSLADGFFSPVGEIHDEDGNTASYAPDDLVNG